MTPGTDITCPVTRAYDWAADNRHQGAGFWMILTLRDGSVVKGPSFRPGNGLITFSETYDTENEKINAHSENQPPTWVRCADVISATVEW